MFNSSGKKRTLGMGTFMRGLTISPFQIPLLAYLFFQALVFFPQVPAAADQLNVPQWSIWNFVVILGLGAGISTFSRFNGSERAEAFGLHLVMLALVVAGGIQIAGHQYGLGDEVAIFLGCWFRSRVLSKSRQAERVAIKIVNDNEGEHL